MTEKQPSAEARETAREMMHQIEHPSCAGFVPGVSHLIALALDAFAARSRWRPISDVPDHVTQVLAWWPYWCPRAVIAWRDTNGAWNCGHKLSSLDDVRDPGPSDYQPLPEPPSEKGH